MKVHSLDPRINRSDLPAENEYIPKAELDQFETYEVFHQTSRGAQHVHVGSVHAPNAEMALLFAKEQYARRMKCVNLWVTKTSGISATSYDDSEMFEAATDKSYREAFGYKNKHLIQKFNEERNLQNR
ncbi:MAG TPA: phenylacetic acid degradation protein [Bacteroidia bacterium]|jgi:ring-1,2-phenylacetyl-CoA epoxidase subunit PaaB|nr:phenylacetic acid degradation protein [Bacteroidia bacterium]